MTLAKLQNTKWTGGSELWLDPLGNTAATSDCTVAIGADSIDYTWSHEGKPHTGKLTLRDGGADFTDTFHSPTSTAFEPVPGSWALVDVLGSYAAPEGPAWGWRIYVSLRPSDELVVQMTNITPWGEDGRAVRMICRRAT